MQNSINIENTSNINKRKRIAIKLHASFITATSHVEGEPSVLSFSYLNSANTVCSESRCALIKVIGSDVHVRLLQAWNRLISFPKTFCRSAFGKSLCTYKRCWKWCPRASIQAWTRLILFANTFCRSPVGKSLCTYKRCWNWWPQASNTGLNPFNFIRKHFLKICVWKVAEHL
jgi:hypothetical protein